MSMDAGGLAQMTYNNFNNAGLGMPGAGFASRGKGSQLKRLSVASPPKVASISETQESVPTPRTSRSHLLAGLRTAPKTPTGPVPASAPYNQAQHRGYNDQYRGYGQAMPQTATGATFGSNGYGQQYGMSAQQQVYSLPEQVLAPPTMQYAQDEQTDPNFLAQLMATELFLEERRKQLQRQLLSLTNQGLPVDDHASYGQQYLNPTMGQQMSYQQQQFLAQQQQQAMNAVQVAFNPLTGQYQYVVDPSMQTQLASSPPPPTPSYTSSPPKTHTPTFRAEVTPPDEKVNPFARSSSPPKKSPSPQADVTPLPPPSANAFRRGHHKKVSSLALNSSADVVDGPRSAITRPVGFPQTPQTGTFGPGQARAGEHPVRQPRGPPSIEELRAAPTTKHEGSKNFATRQRRHAVKNLVRAGIERRGVRSGSPGSMTPVSETDMSYDSDSARSGSLSGKPSIGSLRAAANGAIGSERKELARNRSSADNVCYANSVSSDEGTNVGGKLVEVKVEDDKPVTDRRSMMPRLVLTSAEKRKSNMC
ncbi:hypothetical protein EJ05DRAFT_329446 [Pseudovirgaria hyperparasitica]|uniref:Uncharacterized protein n=1 Tax=Pseudovirgaria hyperparasitica TaxID=470096 RepID=A0A6A6W833_9PEZI|nr:uncharacterized protein EJ05DRAFT_329446 [Pseudovirgaria hyperparasitica]KAF2759012.1 hypothetical protein EJ05DRAFT_329446 [Pseudovirgaria hyperparasitica]